MRAWYGVLRGDDQHQAQGQQESEQRPHGRLFAGTHPKLRPMTRLALVILPHHIRQRLSHIEVVEPTTLEPSAYTSADGVTTVDEDFAKGVADDWGGGGRVVGAL